MTTLGASDDINQEYPKVGPRYVPSSATGLALRTKSGTKRLRVRRCTRTLRLSNDLVVQCQLEQHDADKKPVHEHKLTIFSPDGNAKMASLQWHELGPVTPLILTKGTR